MAIVECTVNYPNFFKARLGPNPKPGDRPKFGATLLFTQEQIDSPGFQKLRAEVVAAARAKFGDKADDLIRRKAARLPFRTDVETKDYPEWCVLFMNVSSNENHQPQVVSRYADASGKAARIDDPKEVFSGCLVNVSLNPFGYDTNGNKGVSAGLGNVQLPDNTGPRLDGRKNAQSEFQPLETAAPMGGDDDLNALLG
jgi:hypothetical protein